MNADIYFLRKSAKSAGELILGINTVTYKIKSEKLYPLETKSKIEFPRPDRMEAPEVAIHVSERL